MTLSVHAWAQSDFDAPDFEQPEYYSDGTIIENNSEPETKRTNTGAVIYSAGTFDQSPLAEQSRDASTVVSGASPFLDPDIIYMEADELINDEAAQILTAQGEVEGRYQERLLRANRVVYHLDTGQIVATGNVTLVDELGSAQYAETLVLSDQLETGTATNFTSRFANGAVTGAAIASRREDGGIDLFKTYYTACEACVGRKPTWQLKARKATQVPERNMIRYRDAVIEVKGIPVFYSPYLSHPDPSADRASGFLTPFGGYTANKGFSLQTPYFFAVDPYTDLTLTPRFYSEKNPLLEYDFRRNFYSGYIELNGSLTYGSAFDQDGDPFLASSSYNNIDLAPIGKRVRSHLFSEGMFRIDPNWQWGFGTQHTSDDLYLNRYGISGTSAALGLHQTTNRRLVSQLYTLGQSDNFRFSASAFGFQSLRTNINKSETVEDTYFIGGEDDSTLPIVAPKIDLSYFTNDPLFNGRVEAFGDFTSLTRKVGTDHTRGTFGANWSKTMIAPGGIEVKPFGQIRRDDYFITPDEAEKVEFGRTLGQVGTDVRWPFIKPGTDFDLVLEPRAQITQSFGDARLDEFSITDDSGNIISLFEDSSDIDFDDKLLWSPNKSTGYDFWQSGLRADVGGSVKALWNNSHVDLFLGQSYVSDTDDPFDASSGLAESSSDYVGRFELKLDKNFNWISRLRYNEENSELRRFDTSVSYKNDWFGTSIRYYKLDSSSLNLTTTTTIPQEQISAEFGLKINKNWSVEYRGFHDVDADITRTQRFTLNYGDDCTLLQLFYTVNKFEDDNVRNANQIGVRLTLNTLGEL